MSPYKKLTHIECRRCGSKSFKIDKKICVSCGFPKSTKLRKKRTY